MRRAEHVTSMGEIRNTYKILIRKPEEKRPLGKPRCRWEDNIKMYTKQIGCEIMDWIQLIQGRVQKRTLVNIVIILRDTLQWKIF
jgi:hypothetical protein